MKKYLIILLIIGFVPQFVSAATISFQTNRTTVSAGDTFIVSAMIDPKTAIVNSVEGDIHVDSDTNSSLVNDFSLAQSIFTLWPRTPSLSTNGSVISFIGGVPGGFSKGKAVLFNIVVEATKEGVIHFSPKNIAIYSNDGKGTRVPVDFAPLDIKVTPKSDAIAATNDWITTVTSDKKNPQKFSIIIGSDPTIFNGKKFAFFTAVDNQSGISYYEVTENKQIPIRSGSMYVLQNQDTTDINLTVTAYDKAGNKTTVTYQNPGYRIFGFPISFYIIIIIVFAIWIAVRRYARSKKNVLPPLS